MSLHRLSAGAGYTYLLRHTACGDVQRAASTPLTAYYTESGYPPGRWYGAGLATLDSGPVLGEAVTELQMARLFGSGCNPSTGAALGKAYPVFAPLAERIANRVANLPAEFEPHDRELMIVAIKERESSRPSPCAVAGFDLTFTIPKSASVLWALADPRTQEAITAAHRAAVDDALRFLEERALFTRVGTGGCAQVQTNGMLATSFDHWDTRTGDPNLHTHVVIANKVQGPDGVWRSLDSRALHHAAVTISELYDDLVADQLAVGLPVRWGWRSRGERRSPAFELDGISDQLLAAFSTRSVQVGEAMRQRLLDFHTTHGRGPTRVEVLQLRQQATRDTRPDKTPHPLTELLSRWRTQAEHLTTQTPEAISATALQSPEQPLAARDVQAEQVTRLAMATLDGVMSRRSTWTRWNVLTEAARATRDVRMATSADRVELLDLVTAAVLEVSIPLDPPEALTVSAQYQRADGTSVFTRPGEHRYSHPRLLDAEQRLLEANRATGAPTVPHEAALQVATAPQVTNRSGQQISLAEDQVAAVVEVATSGRQLDVLVGPAGTGKTTTLRALRTAWEDEHGAGSVLGLAPSATAAHELSAALAINCENTAKWLHESTGAGAAQRDTISVRLQQAPSEQGAAARIARTQSLGAEQARWELQAGQLLIVDEASLAGTLALDELRRQASSAGAKLLLVGDHRQLTAVDAGGAFGLLAERGTASELRSLWRFRHRWEANATRSLRRGDPDILEHYQKHERLHAGLAESMLEAAYQGWQASEQGGESALLVAGDTHTVEALNHRAHEDRIAAGLVAPIGIPLGPDGARGEVSAGDRIVARRNNRRLKVPGHGHVRNGSLWTVVATNPDGSLLATPADRHVTHGCAPDPAASVTLPADYAAEHVDLGYATTAHRAQGLTVDTCHTLVAPGMSREGFYVAMTRGRDANHAYISTDTIDPACDELPDPAAVRTGRQVLERVLDNSSTEKSATQTLTDRDSAGQFLQTLTQIRQTIHSDNLVRRWQPALDRCSLTAAQADRLSGAPARGALIAALQRGADQGHPMPTVLANLIADRPLELPNEPARDLAALLHHRVESWLESASPASRITPPRAATSEDADCDATITQIDQLIADRIAAISEAEYEASRYEERDPAPEPPADWAAWLHDPYVDVEGALSP